MMAVEIFVVVGFVVVLCMAFRDIGYESGYEKGHEQGYNDGRKEADNWWISAEWEVDEARKQIWREEPKKGMEQ